MHWSCECGLAADVSLQNWTVVSENIPVGLASRQIGGN
jgi:hypothetical protein